MNICKKSLLFLAGTLLVIPMLLQGQAQDKSKVMVLEIRDEIDPRMNRYVELGLAEARKNKADYIIIDMDTYGGAVNDANAIVERLLKLTVPVWVFINTDAASAGAYISIACDSIYMSSGASIGAATVVTADAVAAPDKYQSYMRTNMRSTAEATGRNPDIAEAMVDESIEIEGISKTGKVITFSTKDAIRHGYCEAEVASIEKILERNGVTDYSIERYALSGTDKIIDIVLNPFIASILIMIIIGGIYFELQTPGMGFPIVAALIAALLYFIPYYINGLAENWEILAFIIGIGLIAVEIFVIPGFGMAGISGILLMVGSLILVMLNNDFFDFTFVGADKFFAATSAAILGVIASGVLIFFGGTQLAKSKAFSRIALNNVLDKESGYTSNFNKAGLVGKKGTAHTVLRPSGKVMIEGELYDAYNRDGYVEKGLAVLVISDEGTDLLVKVDDKNPVHEDGAET